MINIFNVILWCMSGLTVIGGLGLAIYSYGEMKYYEGRIDKHDELSPLINGLVTTLRNDNKGKA